MLVLVTFLPDSYEDDLRNFAEGEPIEGEHLNLTIQIHGGGNVTREAEE